MHRNTALHLKDTTAPDHSACIIRARLVAGSLLDHIGGYVDPLRLVQQIPCGLAIPRLRDRLVLYMSSRGSVG